MIFLETFLVNLIKSQRIFAIICYYLKYLVSKFRILVHKRTILAWNLIFCSTLSTFRPKCPKANGNNQTKNKLSLIIYFGNPKFWKCLGYSYDWLSIPPLDENLLFRTFVHCANLKGVISGKLEPRGLMFGSIFTFCYGLLKNTHLLHKMSFVWFVLSTTVSYHRILT